jgi:hypothetical protein
MNLYFSENDIALAKAHVSRYIQQNKDYAAQAARIVIDGGGVLNDALLNELTISNGRAAAAYDIQDKLLYMERVMKDPEFTDAGRKEKADNVARSFNSELIRLTRVNGNLHAAGVYMDVISVLSY